MLRPFPVSRPRQSPGCPPPAAEGCRKQRFDQQPQGEGGGGGVLLRHDGPVAGGLGIGTALLMPLRTQVQGAGGSGRGGKGGGGGRMQRRELEGRDGLSASHAHQAFSGPASGARQAPLLLRLPPPRPPPPESPAAAAASWLRPGLMRWLRLRRARRSPVPGGFLSRAAAPGTPLPRREAAGGGASWVPAWWWLLEPRALRGRWEESGPCASFEETSGERDEAQESARDRLGAWSWTEGLRVVRGLSGGALLPLLGPFPTCRGRRSK